MTTRIKRLFPDPIEFEWDDGNSDKNWFRHHVSQIECESVFFNEPLLFRHDIGHSNIELRYLCLGKTKQSRYLFISFTIRSDKIRIISARDMTQREFQEFKKYEKENS